MRAFRADLIKPPREPRYQELQDTLSRFSHCELEIGAGVGWHCVSLAQEKPEALIVGLERTSEKFQKFARRASVHSLPNLWPVHADAVPWVAHLPVDVKFRKIWILYPNPEPGNANQRWINSPFFGELLGRLHADSEIEMATNVLSYADEVLERGPRNWNLQVEIKPYLGRARTHFEKKYLALNQNCFSIHLRMS